MGFKQTEVNTLLAHCHRRCCVCHRFCGIKIEIHHIQPIEDGGDDSIENAIPLCFECHAEVQLYNDKHPRGRKFRPAELREHKEQWLRICSESPGALLMPQRPYDVGPVQALIDELVFNEEIAQITDADITQSGALNNRITISDPETRTMRSRNKLNVSYLLCEPNCVNKWKLSMILTIIDDAFFQLFIFLNFFPYSSIKKRHGVQGKK